MRTKIPKNSQLIPSTGVRLRRCLCRYTDALVNLVPLVLGLHDQLKKAVQDGDVETSHGICRIAVAMGETHSRCAHAQTNTSVSVPGRDGRGSCLCSRVLLEQVEHWQEFLALVNMILFCTAVPGYYPVNETTSSLTLTFWYSLQVRTTDEINSR